MKPSHCLASDFGDRAQADAVVDLWIVIPRCKTFKGSIPGSDEIRDASRCAES